MCFGAIDMGGSKTIVAVLKKKIVNFSMGRVGGHEKERGVYFYRKKAML